jgi:hypothetical protein
MIRGADFNNALNIGHIVMLQCTIVYDSQNRYSVSYDMASLNSLNRWILLDNF